MLLLNVYRSRCVNFIQIRLFIALTRQDLTAMHAPLKILPVLLLLIALGNRAGAQPENVPASAYDRPSNIYEDTLIERIRNIPLEWQFGLNFRVSNPQDTLRRALETLDGISTGYGFGLEAGYYFDPLPVATGLHIGFDFYGYENRRFVVPLGSLFLDTINYEVYNTQIPVNLSLRVQPNIASWVYPYAEVLGGFTLIQSSVSATRASGVNANVASKDESSISWQYGTGVGCMVKVVDIINLPHELQRTLLDIRLRYLWGSAATVSWINVTDSQEISINSQRVESPEIVHFSLGLTFQF